MPAPRTIPKPRVQLVLHVRTGELLSECVMIIPAKKAA